MFCSACGTNNDAGARFCHACGAATAAAPAPAPAPDNTTIRGPATHVMQPQVVTGKNPVLAAVLSAIIVGVGQFYNGDMKKGAIMLGLALVLGVATAGLLWLGVAVWSAIDAYKVANGTGKMW